MPEDLTLSQIGSSLLPPPFRGLHSPGVRKHCQIIFAFYFRKSSIVTTVITVEQAQEGGESVVQSKSTCFQNPELSTIENGHQLDGWPLHATASATVLGFVPTLRFLWSQILCRLYGSPLDETINQGPPPVYMHAKKTKTEAKRVYEKQTQKTLFTV